MQQRIFLLTIRWIFMICLYDTVHSSVLTNICPTTPSCNCTLTNNTDLNIACNSTPFLTQLPVLVPATLQRSVTQLRVLSSTTASKGPLIQLPTNICSYSNLTILDLSSNNISGLLNTSTLACLSSQLTHLDVSYNNIKVIDTLFFKTTRALQSINLSHNNLTTTPSIDSATFINFPSTIISINISFNQIMSVDLWPLFVRTKHTMTIDMSNNLIQNFTNTIPISLEQLTGTPDLRYVYLNNNHLTHVSDLLLEQYDACPTRNSFSTSYFIIGISNMLLTDNPLICDCQSYHLISYISENINDFPDINNGTALLAQATCAVPMGQKYIFTNFTQMNNCDNYVLPTIQNIFCSLDLNNTEITLTPPTYWPTTTTTNGYGTGGNGESDDKHAVDSATTIAWYIVLGVVLGLVVILAVIIVIGYLCRHRFCPKKYQSKILTHVRTDESSSYASMNRISGNSSSQNSKVNGIKPNGVSRFTSARGFDDQEEGTQQSDDGDLQADLKSSSDRQSRNDATHLDQETQANSQRMRSKPPDGRPFSTRSSQQRPNNGTDHPSYHEHKLSPPTRTNGIKGIPISALATKAATRSLNVTDTSTSELSVTSVPLAPSKRAKLLPQIKSGNPVDSTNENLLNTSAGTLITSQRQQRRSSLWFRQQTQNMISALPPRPQSMMTQKPVCDHEGDMPSIPTIESLANKSSKSLRAVPLLNISVVPAWVDQT